MEFLIFYSIGCGLYLCGLFCSKRFRSFFVGGENPPDPALISYLLGCFIWPLVLVFGTCDWAEGDGKK